MSASTTPAPASARLASATTPTSNFTLIKRLLGLVWRYRVRCLLVLAMQFTVVWMTLGILTLTGLGIDFIRHAMDSSARAPRWRLGLVPPAHWDPILVIVIIAALILTFALSWATLRYRAAMVQARLVQDLIVHLRTSIYDKLQRLSFRFFDANETGSIINRVTSDVMGVRLFLDVVTLQTIMFILSLTVYLTYMMNLSATLTLACLATTPILAVLATVFSRIVKPGYRRNRELYDDTVRVLAETVQGIHVVKGFAREEQEIERFRTANRKVRDQQRWLFWRVSIFSPTVALLTQINLAVLLVLGGYMVMQGTLNLGEVIVFAGLLSQVSAQVTNIAEITNSIQQSLTAAQRVFEVLDAPVEIETPRHADVVRLPGPGVRGGVAFESVTFGYEPQNPVLHEVSFRVEPGQRVAILGATAAGKSTLLSLIPRFYDPQQGRVCVDGVDLKRLDLDQLRRSIGLVFQESFLFSNTIAANIAFGHPEAGRAQIEKAAQIACAHEFIIKLPLGYDTVIGENAVDLSGGQRQRLAIARALLLEPSILLLDDPTAAIDPETEHEILQAMDNAMKGRTTFLVAHRISTLRRADTVIVLDKGRIVQMGTHEELMNAKGPYLRAAKLQFADEESRRLLAI